MLHHTPQETTTTTAPASSGQAGRRGSRLPAVVLDIRDASLSARLAASVKLAREQKEEKP